MTHIYRCLPLVAMCVFALSACSDIVMVTRLQVPQTDSVAPSNVVVSDHRAVKGIRLHGLRVASEMDRLKTVPPVADAVRFELSQSLSALAPDDSVKANVVKASCDIANHFSKGSASMELQVAAQFRIAGTWHSKVLVSGSSDTDFSVGFKGVPVKQWCSKHFTQALHDVASQATSYYQQVSSQ